MRRLVLLLGPIVAYVGLIFFLSSLPDLSGPRFPGADKLAHAIEYGVLGALVVRAGRGFGLAPRRAIVAAILLCAVYGVTDELHQAFTPKRQPDGWDLLADVIGGSLGAMLWYAASRRARGAPPSPESAR